VEIRIEIPTRAQIVNNGFALSVASANQEWKKEQLGDYADRSGVYIHHSIGSILYIGITTVGQWGTFGERLRREFQFSSSQNSSLYQLLANQKGTIRTYLLDLSDIEMMIDSGPVALPAERKALILEQVLIGIYEPPGNKK
jgi:hypothetical protein